MGDVVILNLRSKTNEYELEYPLFNLNKLINAGKEFTKQEIQKVLDGVNYDKARNLNYSESGQIALHEVMAEYRNRQSKNKYNGLKLI